MMTNLETTSLNTMDHSSSSHHHASSKGRKGDERYHRAVAARLENPTLTLFQALVAGGFDYPNDDDANCTDSEQVTLGQRKNQLSRRLRMAKKQQQQLQNKEPDVDMSSSNIKIPLYRPMSGVKRGLSTSSEFEPEAVDVSSSERNKSSGLVARNHPDYHALFVPLAAGTATSQPLPQAMGGMNGTTNVGYAAMAPQQQQQQQQHQQQPQQAISALMVASNGNCNNTGHHAPSGVAIASLNQTAQSVGLTLEQLAVALSNRSNVMAVLTQNSTPEKRQELALNLFLNESCELVSKAMLLAGYPAEQTQQGSPQHLEFATAAWQMQGKRLQEMAGHVVPEPPLQVPPPAASAVPMVSTTASHNHEHSHAHGHGHHHHQGSASSPPDTIACYLDQGHGRHIHRLEGKCGHKAILHQPENGTAHIDFIVNDKVECYAGVKPIAPPKKSKIANGGGIHHNISVWPSKYKCEDLNCASECNHQRTQHSHADGSCAPASNPRILQVDDLDMDGAEWNSDYDQSTLLSLFKLSDSTTTTISGDEVSPSTTETGKTNGI